MRTSGGREVRPERSERTLRQQRPAGRATQWRVISITDQIWKACSMSRLFCICGFVALASKAPPGWWYWSASPPHPDPLPKEERGKTNATCSPGVLDGGRYSPFYAGAHRTDLLTPWKKGQGKTNAACLPGVLESGRYPPFYASAHGTYLLAPWREG